MHFARHALLPLTGQFVRITYPQRSTSTFRYAASVACRQRKARNSGRLPVSSELTHTAPRDHIHDIFLSSHHDVLQQGARNLHFPSYNFHLTGDENRSQTRDHIRDWKDDWQRLEEPMIRVGVPYPSSEYAR